MYNNIVGKDFKLCKCRTRKLCCTNVVRIRLCKCGVEIFITHYTFTTCNLQAITFQSSNFIIIEHLTHTTYYHQAMILQSTHYTHATCNTHSTPTKSQISKYVQYLFFVLMFVTILNVIVHANFVLIFVSISSPFTASNKYLRYKSKLLFDNKDEASKMEQRLRWNI